jgi:hypothetical protein
MNKQINKHVQTTTLKLVLEVTQSCIMLSHNLLCLQVSGEEIKVDKMDGTCRMLEGIEKLRCPSFPRPESAANLTTLYTLAR